MSMIKRGVLAVAAVSMSSAGVAQAANVTAEYLYNLNTVGLANGKIYTGYGDMLSVQLNQQAILLDVNTKVSTPLLANGYAGTTLQGLSETQQVGMAFNYTYTISYVPSPAIWMLTYLPDAHAYLWNGSSASGIDLHPAGYYTSFALATDGVHQVGMATYSPSHFLDMHAMLWSGTAESAVDLNPAGASVSQAMAVSGDTQGGSAFFGWEYHAYLWHGSAESGIDLHPEGYTESFVTAIVGDYQFGYGIKEGAGGGHQPLLWNGSAESVVELLPSYQDYNGDYVTAASNSGIQIGMLTDPAFHAVAWQGTPDSLIDLSSLVEHSASDYSLALGIDGNVIYGIASAVAGENAGVWAVKWTIVPEPGSLSLLGLAGLGLLKRRR